MDTIDGKDLERVNGGFIGMLLPLLQAAPGIIQGISSLIHKDKGGDAAPQAADPGAAAAADPSVPAAAQQVAAAASPGMATGHRHVSVTVGSF